MNSHHADVGSETRRGKVMWPPSHQIAVRGGQEDSGFPVSLIDGLGALAPPSILSLWRPSSNLLIDSCPFPGTP